MHNFVATRRVRVAGLVAAAAIVWTVYAPHGLAWSMGLAGASLALVTAFYLDARRSRSMAQVLRDVDAEGGPALVPAPVRSRG
jgi:hypothetical protein